jgi:hypothetical protein
VVWQGKTDKATNPFQGVEGKPSISKPGHPQARYLGRVIIEVWDIPGSAEHDPSGAGGFAYVIDPGSASKEKLLQRITNSFGQRLANDKVREQREGPQPGHGA